MLKKVLSILLSAVAAAVLLGSSAQATPLFQASEYPASITGPSASLHAFMGNSGAYWFCGIESSMGGAISEASSTVTLTPTYANCTILEIPMTVKTNGCSYRLHVEEATEEHTFRGRFDIVCPGEKGIEFSGLGCVWRFGPQQGVSGFTATVKTAAEPEDVHLRFEGGGISHSEEGIGFACPNKGTFNSGKLQAEVTLGADGPGGSPVPFWIE